MGQSTREHQASSNRFEDEYAGVWKQHPQRHEKMLLSLPLHPHGLNGTLCDVKEDHLSLACRLQRFHTAWGIEDKFMFLVLLVAAMVVLISVVHYWPLLSALSKQLGKGSTSGSSTGKSVGKAAGADGASPQFNTEEGETVAGALVE